MNCKRLSQNSLRQWADEGVKKNAAGVPGKNAGGGEAKPGEAQRLSASAGVKHSRHSERPAGSSAESRSFQR